MRLWTFASRNTKEILRDPLNLGFGLGFPIVLLLLLTAIQANIPVELFAIQRLAPGIAVFGLSFITLFSASLVARDRKSAFLQRLYTTPLTALDFILGYTLPLLPISFVQCGVCYAAAWALGLPLGGDTLLAMGMIIPVALFYTSIGLLCGSVLTDKQVGGICGALLTNIAAWLSGIWFDLELIGGAFQRIAYGLPFVHAVELERAVINGNLMQAIPHLWWVLGYGVGTTVLAILLFLRQMRRQ